MVCSQEYSYGNGINVVEVDSDGIRVLLIRNWKYGYTRKYAECNIRTNILVRAAN